MSENKNIGNMLSEFFRYVRDELTGKERNSLERKLQKNPFEEDALDGFSSISEQEAVEDISVLNEKLKRRISRKSGLVIYRIAGIVALLLTVSAVLVLTIIKNPDNQLAINTPGVESFEIIRNHPIIASESKDNKISSRASEEKKSVSGFDQNIDTPEKPEEISNDEVVSESKAFASKEEIPRELIVSVPAAAMARKRSPNGYTVRGQVFSAEDNLPIPGANIQIKGTTNGAITNPDGNFSISLPDSSSNTLIASFIGMESKEIRANADSPVEIKLNSSSLALNEVVVTGYSSKKSDALEEEDISDYMHPQPATGKSEFDEYVKNNLHRPDIADGGKKVVVVLSFLVRTTGQIDSIRIIKSPGKAYSDEAIRVIKSGPDWNPATDNGKPIEEDVRLRIVFK
jgi:hypothetical protein